MASCGTRVRKGFLGGWVATCPKHGKIGTYHLAKDARKARCRHGGW